MRTYSPLFLLATLGVLCHSAPALADVDTTQWKCKSCPYPKDMNATVDVGLAAVSDDSAKFGDYTGLHRKGAHLLLGGSASYRSESGYFAELSATDLGLASRGLAAHSGREGIYSVKIGYDELPRYFTENAATPFRGVGSGVLTLPAGYPAAGTSTMPLGSTQQSVDVGFKKKQFGVSAAVVAMDNWTYRASFKHDVRDGTRPMYGSFFSSATQLVAPVDQVTDQLEVSAAYATRSLQASLAYQISRFSNGTESLTWDNPYWPVVPGATRGQMALAPDNQLHQIVGSAGYQITPTVRASADFAYGRLTQNATYLAPTLNTALAGSVAALPAQSLDGRVDTFNGNVKLSAAPLDDLRLTATYARDVRDNRSEVQSYPLIDTDIFVHPESRSNTPFSLTQDRMKLNAEYRGVPLLKLSGGLEGDWRSRPYTEVVKTRESTAWARAGVQAHENAALSLRLSHSERTHSTYGTAIWFGSPENPLMRKYNLAARKRDMAGTRADLVLTDKINLGFSIDYANDAYSESAIGLQMARSVHLAADVSVAITEHTQVTFFGQTESMDSRQTGSTSGGTADWKALHHDRFNVLGASLKHTVIANVLDIGIDGALSRARSDISVLTGSGNPLYPTATTSAGSLKVHASYKLKDNLWLNGGLRHERYTAADWRVDGVVPGAVQNLLTLEQQTPDYKITLVSVSLRYRF